MCVRSWTATAAGTSIKHDAGERIDCEPFLILNLVLVRATLFHDDSAAHPTLNAAAMPSGPGFRIRVSSGAFNIANPIGEAVHMNVRVDLVSGGRNGRRELANVFAGWVNNESLNEDICGTFQDPGLHGQSQQLHRVCIESLVGRQ